MKKLCSIGVALLCLGFCSTSVIAEQGNVATKSTPQQSTQAVDISASDEATVSNQYKEAVLKHMDQGETVSVPADKIGYLKGTVKFVSHERIEPAKLSTKDAGSVCYDSCQTLCKVTCHQACTWDCRIINNEKVCDESCKTICPEVCNVTCHRVCP